MGTTVAPALVIKAPSEAEVQEICDQLAHLALFGDVFKNKYEGGWACKGTFHPPEQYGDAQGADALAAQLRQSAALLGQLQEQITRLEEEVAARDAKLERWAREADRRRAWEALDTLDEYYANHGVRSARRNTGALAAVSQEELERRARLGWRFGDDVPPTAAERAAQRSSPLLLASRQEPPAPSVPRYDAAAEAADWQTHWDEEQAEARREEKIE